MMKRLLLALVLVLFAAPAMAATCSNVSPQLKDNTPTTFNVPYVDDGTGSGDCQPKVSQGLAGAGTSPWYVQPGTGTIFPIFGAAGTPVTMQNAAVANGNGTTLTVSNYNTALINVNCSVSCSGGTTINFEGTDSTGTYFSVQATPVAGTSGSVNSATASGQFCVNVIGYTTLRARISAYSAGTITVTGTPAFGGPCPTDVVNSNTNGQQLGASSSPTVLATDQLPLVANLVKGTTAAMTGTASTQVLAAVAGKVLYVNFVKCTNSSATATLVQIEDGSGGTVLDTLIAPAGGGEVDPSPTAHIWTTSGNGLYAQNVTTSASVICTASGFHL